MSVSKRHACGTCDLWRKTRNTCGVLAILDLPAGADLISRSRTWFDVIVAPPAPNARRPPGWSYERHRAAIESCGYDDAAVRSYLQGDEASCAVYRPLNRITAEEGRGILLNLDSD